MFTKNMVIGIIILIVILVVALIAFSFIRYRIIDKRNKAADKAPDEVPCARAARSSRRGTWSACR